MSRRGRPARSCPVAGCANRLGGSYLFCATHWHQLPSELRAGLYGRGYGSPAPAIQRLIARAIAVLAEPGDRPVAIPRSNSDAPAVSPADVSAPEGRSSRSALAANQPEHADV